MLRVNIADDGAMSLDTEFLVDFGLQPGGPYLAVSVALTIGFATVTTQFAARNAL